MMNDGLGDWRHRAADRIKDDIPAAYPGGPSHKAGSPLYLASVTRDLRGQIIGFIMPSPAALALSVSLRSAKAADAARVALKFENQVSPYGKARGIPEPQSASLYDFFEHCMITTTFSFNALEIFANQVIADHLKQPYVRTTKRGDQMLSSDKVQNDCTLEEKLTRVLPSVLGLDNPEDKAFWSEYGRLKRVRHTTIHMKPSQAYSQQNVDRETLFYEFFSMGSLTSFPQFAIDAIDFLRKPSEPEQRWLKAARILLAE